MLELYHYVHCPFCLRVRFTLGLLGKEYRSHVLSYDDEKTPIDLMGQKMLPIVRFEDGDISNESLDIIEKLDSENRLNVKSFIESEEFKTLETRLNAAGSIIHSLVMPYWAYTPEFNENSRKYFVSKKSQKRGPFGELMKKRKALLEELKSPLTEIENGMGKTWAIGDGVRIQDILVASHLWGLYCLPEFQFSDRIHQRLQAVSKKCRFSYHEDFFDSKYWN